MALGKCAAFTVLARQTHRIAFQHERTEGQCLGRCPVDGFAGFKHLFFGLELAHQRTMQVETVWHLRQTGAELLQHFFRDTGIAAHEIIGIFLFEARPLAVQPVCLVRLKIIGRLKRIIQHFAIIGRRRVNLGLRVDTFLDQPSAIFGHHRLVLFDFGVHVRLGESRFIALIMPVAAIAEHINHNRF